MKFFRRTRQESLSTGRTRKYLKYALGEIILVVIGILIALSINNWNQKEQLKEEEIRTLKSLQESIRINIAELASTYEAQVQRNNSLRDVLFIDISNQTGVYLDSLITKNITNHTFDPSTGIYNSMINSGKIELISNDSLKNKISKLYDSVKDYQESEDEITEYTKEHLERNFIDNFSIDPAVLAGLRKRTAREERKDKDTYIKTFNSSRVKNMYILLLSKMNSVIVKGQRLKSEYQSLVSALEEEINQRR